MIGGFMFKGILVALSAVLLGSAAFAQDSNVSSTGQNQVLQGRLKDEKFGIKPMVGVVSFPDQGVGGTGNTTSRLGGGIDLEFNVTGWLSEGAKVAYLGVSTGLIYSH